MNRSGYVDAYDDSWHVIKWRGAVASAVRGKRAGHACIEPHDRG